MAKKKDINLNISEYLSVLEDKARCYDKVVSLIKNMEAGNSTFKTEGLKPKKVKIKKG